MTEAAEATRRTPGTPCWVSLMVHGLGSTEDFYADLFGWEYVPGPEQLGPYVRAVLDGQEVAGIGEMPPDGHLPMAWTTYLATDDADATAESVRACGGTVAVGPLDAGAAGRVAICSDPLGAVFGLWQTQARLGARPGGAPGTPVWHELITQDTSAVGKFYEHVFGHEAQTDDTAPDDFDHLTLNLAGGRRRRPRRGPFAAARPGSALAGVLRGGGHRRGRAAGRGARRARRRPAPGGPARAAGHGRGPGGRGVRPRALTVLSAAAAGPGRRGPGRRDLSRRVAPAAARSTGRWAPAPPPRGRGSRPRRTRRGPG